MAVNLKDIDTLAERVPVDAKESYLDARWHGKAARRFVAGTKFADFLASQKEFYDRSAADLRAVADRADFGWFEKFFGVRAGARFYVIPGLVNGGGSYRPGLHAEDRLEENYQMIEVWQVEAEGRPVFDRALVSTPIRSRSIGRRGNFRGGTRGHAAADARGRADGAERHGMRWRATDRTRQSATSHTSAGAGSFGPANSMICWGSTRRSGRSIRRCRHSCHAWWSTSMSFPGARQGWRTLRPPPPRRSRRFRQPTGRRMSTRAHRDRGEVRPADGP